MVEQDRLKEYLVDPMRRLRRRPVAVRAVFCREAIAAAGNLNARQLLTRKRGAIADVVRVVRGQTGIAHLVGDPEPPEDLHRPCSDMVAFWFRRNGAAALLHQRDIDTPPRQIDRERQPDSSRTNDQHLRLSHLNQSSSVAGAY